MRRRSLLALQANPFNAIFPRSYVALSGGAFPLKSAKAIKALARGDAAAAAWRMPPFDPSLGISPTIAAFVQRCLTPDPVARPDAAALLS